MTGWPAGFAIHERATVADPELVGAFCGIPTTIVSDCLGGGAGAVGLRPFHGDPSLRLCGVALTVRVRPGDNLMLHKALTLARPGDVVVVDGAGETSYALAGGLMRLAALSRGVVGLVVDGALRDVEEWAEGELLVFARGSSPRKPSKDGPGEINVPVGCAGLLVSPGDLVLGDADGVVSAPPQRLASLLEEARALLADEEEKKLHHLAARQDPSLRARDEERVDAWLRAKGCPV